ncbi:MAG: FecR domain-containing protein [Chitinophagaceae bacterium]
MMSTEKGLSELLERYLAGHCTAAEKAAVEEWFEQAGDPRKTSLYPDEAAKERMLDHIHRRQNEAAAGKHRTKLIPLRRVLKIAAVCAGLLLATGWLIGISHRRDQKTGTIATVSYKEVRTATGETKKVSLPDGSEITLNANSAIRYPASFAHNRQIHLTGEAFFSIAKDPAHPLTVYADKGIADTVLGTSFNISTYAAAAEINISIVTGRVRISKAGKALDTLTRGQAVSFNGADEMTKSTGLNTDAFISWMKGEWTYDNFRLPDLAMLLRNQYGISLTASPVNKKLQTHVSVNFTRHQTAAEIIEVFASLTGCRFRFANEKEVLIY